ncbi:putative LRR receptor-like serine/threonine-protein kinase [Raphanus sativus]|nr:putative LRR receptor-like serine/threonine-protein kinase [Raphanus sativus]
MIIRHNNLIYVLMNIVHTLRYPDDAYDRLWNARSLARLTYISTTSDVSNGIYNLPKSVLQNAATPTNASLPWTIEWTRENPDDQFYVYLHFAEIQDLQANETREFSVLLDGNLFANPVIPKKFEITTIQSQYPRTCERENCSLQLTRTPRSTLPPLLNAYEIYRVIQFVQPETNEAEVVALKGIQETYRLIKINWQGDPCVPRHLMWDGLTCSNTTISRPPRVTSLNLSSTGLTGTIAAAIQNLTQLETLDLSNNKLTGEVPEFLGNIKSLLFIDLSGNDLNGSIPQSLQSKGIELL